MTRVAVVPGQRQGSRNTSLRGHSGTLAQASVAVSTGQRLSFGSLRLRAHGSRVAANDGWCFVDQLVIRQRIDHEKGEVDPTRQVALQDWIADVAAPDGDALARALLEVASADYGPSRVTGKHASGRVDLISEIHNARAIPTRAGIDRNPSRRSKS